MSRLLRFLRHSARALPDLRFHPWRLNREELGVEDAIVCQIEYPRNAASLLHLLNLNAKVLAGNDCIQPSILHCSLIKMGFRTDQMLCKVLKNYGSTGRIDDGRRLFWEFYRSEDAGLAVWNNYFGSLAVNGCGNDALTVFENMPPELKKTHSTYWITMVACSHMGEPEYAHYLLGKAFKVSGLEPSVQMIGTLCDALARNNQGGKAVEMLQGFNFKPNSAMIVAILAQYQQNQDPSIVNDFVRYLEEQDVSFSIDAALYRDLATWAGVIWGPNVKIQKRRTSKGSVGFSW